MERIHGGPAYAASARGPNTVTVSDPAQGISPRPTPITDPLNRPHHRKTAAKPHAHHANGGSRLKLAGALPDGGSAASSDFHGEPGRIWKKAHPSRGGLAKPGVSRRPPSCPASSVKAK